MERRTYALEIAYLGTHFSGFARQPGRRTVEGVLRSALEAQGLNPGLAVAGRTDAGVHARRQLVSFRMRAPLDLEALRLALSPAADLRLLRAGRVEDSFHARASAIERRYLYRLRIGGCESSFRWVLPEASFDWERAAAVLEAQLGAIDRRPFTTRPSASKITSLREASLRRLGARRLVASFRADGYTRHLIRNWMAAAIAAAAGKPAPSSSSHGFHGRPAPAGGLCLWEIDYGRDPFVR